MMTQRVYSFQAFQTRLEVNVVIHTMLFFNKVFNNLVKHICSRVRQYTLKTRTTSILWNIKTQYQIFLRAGDGFTQRAAVSH